MAPYPGFVFGSNVSQSPTADAEDCINWYPEIIDSKGATSRIVLYPTPGLSAFATGSAVGGKAIFSTAATDSRCFAVFGASLVEVLSNGTQVVRGTVASDANPATITTNGDGGGQLLITSGGNGYSYDLGTDVLTQVANLNGKATMGGFAYGYGLVFDKATGTVYLSDLFDFTVFDPTQYFQRTIGSDDWASMLVTSWGQIFLPGTKTRDYWYNAGTYPVPFAPAQSGLQADGIAATFSCVEAGGTVFWLSTNADGGYEVLAAEGYRSKRVSTHAIEYQISRFSRVDDAIGASYKDQGHTFYLLKFPSADITLVFDLDSGLWHKRGTWVPDDNAYVGWRPTFHCFAFGRHLWADSDSATVYESDIATTTDVDGLVIRRVRQAPSLVRNHNLQYYNRFEVFLESGLGNVVDPAADPTIVMQMSNDGGKTWGHERTASAGAIGQYLKRCYWERNGAARDRAFRIIVTDPIDNWRIIDAYLDVEPSIEAA